MTSWLSDASANRHIKTYVKDFLDLSGNLTVRNAEDYDWNSYGQVLSGPYESDGNVLFGMSVAMDASGTTIVTSAPSEDNGAVRAYRYDSTAEMWYQLGDNIRTEYIKRVAISDDGSRVVAFNSNAGDSNMGFHVYDYDASSNSWTNVGSVLVGVGHQEQSGNISGDGNTIVVAENNNDTNGTNSGETNIYRYAGSGTWNLIGTFRGDGTVTNMNNSSDACTSFDGNRVVISEKGGTNTSATVTGRVTIYDYSGSGASWTQVGSTLYGNTASQNFGESNSFSKDGSILAVGGSKTNPQVRVYQYSSSASDWVQLGSTILSNESRFGYGVRLSQDGTTVIINSVETSSASNKIFAFEYINGDWVTKGSLFIGRFADNSVNYGGAFGTGLDINEDGTKIVVGGSAADLNSTNSGAVQAFQWSNKTYTNPMLDISGGTMTVWGGAEENANNWSVTNVNTFSDGTDQYGGDMKFNADGTIMIVGEWAYNSDAGRIHAYKYRNGLWSKMGSDVADSNITHEGFSVSINDSGLIIGSGGLSAIAIVWEFINGDWSVKGGEIVNNNVSALGHRGSSLNGEGNIVAWRGNDGAAIYQYNSVSDSWNQLGSDFTGLTHNDNRNSISLNQAGNIVAITDPGYDSPSTDAGRVGIFQYDSSNNNWDQLGDWITAPSTTSGGNGDHYGTTVSLSSDGYIVAFGTTIGEGATVDYHARIFQYVPSVGQWTPRSPDVQNDNVTTAAGAGAKVGNHVALSGDGNTLVVNDQDAQTASGVYGGAVHVFKYIDGMYKWVTRLDGPAGSTVWMGASGVAISRDGTRFGGSREGSDYVRIGDIVNNPALKIMNGSTIMNGNVGIGKDSPSSKLHIQHDQSSMPTGQNFDHGGTLILENKHANTVLNYGANIKFVSLWNSSATTSIEFGAIAGYNGFDGGFGGGLTFWTHPNSNSPMVERMRINDNGYVGIGTTSPNHSLHVYAPVSTDSIIKVSSGTSTNGMLLQQGTDKWTYIRNTESTGGMIFHAGNAERIRVNPNGYVGIGTSNPYATLSVHQLGYASTSNGIRFSTTSTSNPYWNQHISSSWNLIFSYKGTTRGYLDQTDANSQLNFTGQHRTFVQNVPFNNIDYYKGLIVSSDQNKFIKMSGGIEKGNKSITINESLPIVSISTIEKDKKCFGVISESEDKDSRTTNIGHFVSRYNKELGDTRIYINSVGEGAMWVSNKNGSLESGDYITTSSIPGYGQKQDDDVLHNYSVAKILMDCDFNPQLQYKEQIVTKNIDISGPDASGNYYDTSNNQRLYTKVLDDRDAPIDNENTNYNLAFDASNNLISVTQNVLDANGEIQWEDTEEQERAYEIRHVDPSGNIITEEEYNTKIAAGQEAYIAAFVGCTYHCG